jgi:ubiquinone biosynthesis protein COQ4
MQPRVAAVERSHDREMYLSSDASLSDRFRGALKAFDALQKVPNDPLAGMLLAACLDGDRLQHHAARLLQTEAGRALFAERPEINGATVDLEQLGRYDEGTVGRAFAQYFAENGILPLECEWDVRNDSDYLLQWYRQTHDLHHIIMGYGTDAIGEMEVQAFMMGNIGFRHSVFILVASALVRPAGLPPIWKYWDRLVAAYRRGKRAGDMFAVRFDHSFAATLETLRTELAIPA